MRVTSAMLVPVLGVKRIRILGFRGIDIIPKAISFIMVLLSLAGKGLSMRLLSNPDEDLLPPTDLMAARRSAAELPPFMRFSRSGSSPAARFWERDDGLAQRYLESSSIELDGAEGSLVSGGVVDVVGWGLRA